MKTTLKFLCIITLCAFFSCETDVPDTDTAAPDFSLKIDGDGFDRTFTKDDNLETGELKLKNGATYNFILSGVDQGGIKQVQFQFPSDYIELTETPPAPWQTQQSGLSTITTFNGDRNNALTARILTGDFEVNGEGIFATMYIRIEDFGGDSGPFNVTEVTINIHIDNHNTEFFELI